MRTRHDRARRAVEAHPRDRTAVELVGRMASTVAHDLNNLFATISGSCHLLRPSLGSEQDALEDLAAIERAADAGAALIDQWLLLRSDRPADPTEFDLNAVTKGMERMLRRLTPQGVTLQCVPGRDLWAVRGDRRRVEQALAILVMRAADAVPVGGRLTIQTSNVQLLDEAPGRHVVLGVSAGPHEMDSRPEIHGAECVAGAGTGDAIGVPAIDAVIARCGGIVRLDAGRRDAVTFRLYLRAAPPRDGASPRRRVRPHVRAVRP